MPVINKYTYILFQAVSEDDCTGDVQEDDINLQNIVDTIGNIEVETDLSIDPIAYERNELTEIEQTENDDNEQTEYDDLPDLEQSMEILSLMEVNDSDKLDIVDLLKSFGFSKFVVPPLLCRHPSPAIGKDDDISKIKEILDDILIKLAFCIDPDKKGDKILCGPDHKIGKCLLKLMESSARYRVFLPEFPLLHLRKSKITILFSAYKEAGLVQLVKFMRDEEHSDWTKLVSVQHIDVATRYVKRVALSLQLAFLVVFSQTLQPEELESFMSDMESLPPLQIAENWNPRFETFISEGRQKNATFSLHYDIMTHCSHVVAISLAERQGGPDGYSLLLYAVKESLLFSFLNNASSYAPYCVQLLHSHFSAGYFHRNMKEMLYSTPFKKSNRNFACDTKRELDHIEAVKGFRSGSNISSITVRMSLIDSLNEACHRSEAGHQDKDNLGWELTQVDENHIFPTTGLILRRNGLSLEENDIPFNVYSKSPVALPKSILDEFSQESGKYLLLRYLCQQQLFGFSGKDLQSLSIANGPTELISRAKRSKGITIKRLVKSKISSLKTEKQLKEEERQKSVSKQTHLAHCFSSENNNCQALLKPDSSKPKVMKSISIQRAIRNLLNTSIQAMDLDIKLEDIMNVNATFIPKLVNESVKLALVEFAGIKFKVGGVKTGREYLQLANSTISSIVKSLPYVSKVVVCEEKYSFTPDEFKAGTRAQRQSVSGDSVAHLKLGDRILSELCFNKDAITKTMDGKKLISTFLAQNMDKLSFDQPLEVIFDSELHLTCTCSDEPCCCQRFCTPVGCQYNIDTADTKQITHVTQRKGEAEMAQLDWLISLQDDIKEGDAVASIVTSGDIDSVYIHMFVVSRLWPRYSNGSFKNPIFVILQKPRSRIDIYNVTKMLEVLERSYADKEIGSKLAVSLCMGGNDFMPKCHQISHDTILKLLLTQPYRQNLFFFQSGKITVNQACFVEFYKTLYCPKRCQPSGLTFEEVRAITIAKSTDEKHQSGFKTRDPRKWLPPESALQRLYEMLQLQIQYLETAGDHSACLPAFLNSSCLQRSVCGEIEYNFGPDVHFTSFDDLPDLTSIKKSTSRKDNKRQPDSTPQGGARRKRPLTSTPRAER